MTLWEHLKGKMQKYPQQTVSEGEVTMTYGEIVAFAERFAEKLVGQRCCAVYCESEMLAAIALLCCFAADVTAVPLSKRYGENHCRKIYEHIGPTGVITDKNGKLELYENDKHTYRETALSPRLIMCTSGTTGHPKGAMLSDRNILTNISDISDYFKIESSDTILIARPVYHCAVLTGEFLVSLIKGVRIVFYSAQFNPVSIISLLKREGITVFGATPTVYNMLLKFIKNKNDIGLRAIVISGECLAEPIAKRVRKTFPKAQIYHVYGLTEACPRVCYLPPELFDEYCDFAGVPLNSVLTEIRDADGVAVTDGTEGVLWVKGDNVMEGYYNDIEQTHKVLRDGWLCTGDIAVKNDKGLIKILGRSDELIISAGMNIYPAEIESLMLSDSRVKEVRVMAKKDDTLNTRLVMELAGDFADTDQVRKVCKTVLAPFQMPTEIRLLPELSKNGSGKVVRR